WYMLFWVYVIFGICYFLVYVILLPVVCRLLRRCWLPSHKNFAALKKFGVCDNKHFDFDLWRRLRRWLKATTRVSTAVRPTVSTGRHSAKRDGENDLERERTEEREGERECDVESK